MQFETNRLILRPRTMDDFDACLSMDKAPGVLDFIRGPWGDDDAHRAFIAARIKQDYGKGLGYWSIFTKDNPDQFIGWMLLIPEDAVGPDIEIGWRLHPDHHGKGIGFEAGCVIVDHAFVNVGLDRIVAGIDRRNLASRRLAEKLGMRARNQDDGDVLYELTRAEYCAKR